MNNFLVFLCFTLVAMLLVAQHEVSSAPTPDPCTKGHKFYQPYKFYKAPKIMYKKGFKGGKKFKKFG